MLSVYSQVRELISEGLDSRSKSSERHDVLKLLTLPTRFDARALSVIMSGPPSNILCNLAAPNLSAKLKKSPTGSSKLRRRNILDVNVPARNDSRVSHLGLTLSASPASVRSLHPTASGRPLGASARTAAAHPRLSSRKPRREPCPVRPPHETKMRRTQRRLHQT